MSPTKPSLRRTLLFPLAVATLLTASLHAAGAPAAPGVALGSDDGSWQPFSRASLEETSSRELWRVWLEEIDQTPFTLATPLQSQAGDWFMAVRPLRPEDQPARSPYPTAQAAVAQPAPFTNPQPFARAATAAVSPPPQGAGQTLDVGPYAGAGGTDNSNYTVQQRERPGTRCASVWAGRVHSPTRREP